MEGRHSGRGHEHGPRHHLNEQDNGEPVPEQNRELRVDPNAQVVTAIQRMTNLLAYIVDRQGQNPVNQPENPENHVEGEDRTLERFQKFSPPKFLGGSDPDVAKRWLEKMIDIFAALHYIEERQVTLLPFSSREQPVPGGM